MRPYFNFGTCILSYAWTSNWTLIVFLTLHTRVWIYFVKKIINQFTENQNCQSCLNAVLQTCLVPNWLTQINHNCTQLPCKTELEKWITYSSSDFDLPNRIIHYLLWLTFSMAQTADWTYQTYDYIRFTTVESKWFQHLPDYHSASCSWIF